MNTVLQCPRKDYYANELGLQSAIKSLALRIGSAWHKAMEYRWIGKPYKAALSWAIPDWIEGDDAYTAAILSGLLYAYYQHYGKKETAGKWNSEVQFKSELSHGFTSQGVMDNLGSLTDGRSALFESKTNGESLNADSDYWLRLRFNMQVMNYIVEARALGWNLSMVYYDVTRKPSIAPKQVGKKKDKHKETPDEFRQRLIDDIASRPDFYFQRREIPIFEAQVQDFILQRNAIIRMIVAFRRSAFFMRVQAEAWPRNVGVMTCNFCQFKSFCLQNITVNPEKPPQGFTVKHNPELQNDTNTDDTTTG